MENLGHYLLSARISLPGDTPLEVYEGQDVRTGIVVMVFKPLSEELPKTNIPGALAWLDKEDSAWIAEVPVGSVQTSMLAGRVEPARILGWAKQLVQVVHAADEQGIPIGWIVPELVWARGSKVWLGGVGIVNPAQKIDYAGLLQTIRTIAGDTYQALPWCVALEKYATGELEYPALLEQLETVQPEPAPLEAAPSNPEPQKPITKSLKVQEGEPQEPSTPPSIPPKRIRIEDSLNPSFEVLEPRTPSRRSITLWLLGVPFLLLISGLFFLLRPKPPSAPPSNTIPVEFRLQPPGPTASIEVLEVPEGSKLPLNTILAQVPGRVDFDRAGVYRIRVRVQGRAPVESIIEVPNPAGVTIALK